MTDMTPPSWSNGHNWQTVTDVVKELREANNKEHGLPWTRFHEEGILIDAAAQELRRRGYEIEVFDQEGDLSDRRMRLLAMPAAGAKRRKKDQMSLLGAIQPDSPLGPNG